MIGSGDGISLVGRRSLTNGLFDLGGQLGGQPLVGVKIKNPASRYLGQANVAPLGKMAIVLVVVSNNGNFWGGLDGNRNCLIVAIVGCQKDRAVESSD